MQLRHRTRAEREDIDARVFEQRQRVPSQKATADDIMAFAGTLEQMRPRALARQG